MFRKYWPSLLAASVLFMLVLPMPGCASTPAPDPSPPVATTPAAPLSALDKIKVVLTKLHNVHHGLADLSGAVADAGLVHGTTASTIDDVLQKSETALALADQAVTIGDAGTAQAKLAEAETLIAQATALIPPH